MLILANSSNFSNLAIVEDFIKQKYKTFLINTNYFFIQNALFY